MKLMFYVKVCPETSELLQKIAFDNGFEWHVSGKTVSHTEIPTLYFWDNYRISHGNRYEINCPLVDICTAIKHLKNMHNTTLYFDRLVVNVDKRQETVRINNDAVSFSNMEEIYQEMHRHEKL